jgi:hypothetical protein
VLRNTRIWGPLLSSSGYRLHRYGLSARNFVCATSHDICIMDFDQEDICALPGKLVVRGGGYWDDDGAYRTLDY